MTGDRTIVDTIKTRLTDPQTFLAALGIRTKREASRVRLECPWCGSRSGCYADTRQGVILARCHGCSEGGDAFAILAAVRGLDSQRDFPALRDELAGLASVDAERAQVRPMRPARPLPLPPRREVKALWDACLPCAADPEVSAWLASRGLDPDRVDVYRLARSLPEGVEVPRWASYRGDAEHARPWSEIGYRCVIPLYDEAGELRSVRARAVRPVDGGKSTAPSGFTTKGVLMLCPCAKVTFAIDCWEWFARREVVITEGEPDFLTWASHGEGARDVAVIGLPGAGAWTPALAARIPSGSKVSIRTDNDRAGDGYAKTIADDLRDRCEVWETHAAERAERRAQLGVIGRVSA